MNLPAKYPPISPKTPFFLHGGDYNPDQWPEDVWAEDMRLMKLAGCNAMSVGIFSWATLEPVEGRFEFGWLDQIMDLLAKNGAFAVLATPSGARPAWMSQKYPQVLRVDAGRVRQLHGKRHNHCFSSPIYREKVRIINTKLAERYKDHPALIVWHVSNEYGGDCHCPLCQEAFRGWLRRRYENDIEKLNHAWWTGFWSHRFNDFEQVESPSPIGEDLVHGHNLDWKRFVTDQTVDFFRGEIATLKAITPRVPVTTNLMGVYPGLNYWKFGAVMDVVSWDHYPTYHDRPDTWLLAVSSSFLHDLNRSLKGGQPFMQMEMAPSMTNWMPIAKLKRPGVLMTEAMQAIAHGADTIQYFQWRKSRGSSEKFHGAVVDHCGHEHNRVFGEVAELGAVLKKLDAVIGTTTRPSVAVVYDWENRWALEDAKGPRTEKKDYNSTVINHYRPFWMNGVPVDVLSEDGDFERYKLVIAPMMYMVRKGVGERLEKFVREGGIFVTTYWSGIVDESDLCFLGGFPGPLRKMLGIWAEEIDALYEDERVKVVAAEGNDAGLSGTYEARTLVDVVHAEGAKVLATFGSEFYAGRPAVTVNTYGKGKAYYIASRNDERFHADLLGGLMRQMGLRRTIEGPLPEGVTAQTRSDGKREFVFLLNFKRDAAKVNLGAARFKDVLTGAAVGGEIELAGNGSRVIERA
ncbi:MAG: beta-galactosidase [Phycisphaeraceae bacterium]|nr:beta-galactosidase [Phycisphaeraceae bacterium]